MPATHKIDTENGLIITTWEGEATTEEFIDILKKYQNDIQCLPELLGYNEVFDVRHSPSISFNIQGLIKIGRVASRTDHLFSNKKLAFVVDSNWAYRLVQMYRGYRNLGSGSKKIIGVYKNLEDAINWAKL